MSDAPSWQELPLNRIIRMRSGDFIAAEDIEPEGQYPVYGGNGFRGFTDQFNTVGPIVLVGRQGAHCGNIHVAENEIWVSEHALRCLSEKELDARWLAYALQGMNLNQYSVSAAQPGLSVDNLKHLRVAFPPLDTQQRIARFLDEKTARIDGLIEKKRALLDRLAEKRHALITHAVTKGFNSDARMKPSGIDWLGNIPENWDVAALGYRYEVQLGRMLNAERAGGENLKPYLRVLDVQWGHINTENLPVMDFPPNALERYRLQPGDLLVNEGGSYVGRSAIWKGELEECYYQKALHRLRPFNRQQDTAEFLYYVMEAATTNMVFVAGGNQTTIDHLTAEQLRHYVFGFPPFDEQISIASTLGRILGEVSKLVARIEISILKLEEYRAATITAAVTGQIAELQ